VAAARHGSTLEDVFVIVVDVEPADGHWPF
jgi:hypothetical protein